MDAIEKKLKQFDVAYLKAFVPLVFTFLGFVLFDVLFLTTAAYAGAILDDLHSVPFFFPQFLTFVAAGIHGAFKSIKINAEKCKFKEDHEKDFLLKEKTEIDEEIELLNGYKAEVEKKLRDLTPERF